MKLTALTLVVLMSGSAWASDAKKCDKPGNCDDKKPKAEKSVKAKDRAPASAKKANSYDKD